MILSAFDYYQRMKEAEIILIYCGPVWTVSVEELGETILRRLELDDLSVSASHSIFSAFIEQMNNISLYSAEKDIFGGADGRISEVARGVCILGTVGGKYFLQCGNAVHKRAREGLKNRIDYLNSLDKPTLRKHYKEQLGLENSNPESRGAGLGLVEIARRASSKMTYSFTPMDNGLSFYSLLVEMDGK